MLKRINIEVVYTIATRALYIAGQLIYLKCLTKFVLPEELGFYYQLITLAYFFNALLFVPFDYFQQSKIHTLHLQDGSLAALIPLNLKLATTGLFLAAATTPIAIFFLEVRPVLYALALVISVLTYLIQAVRGAFNITTTFQTVNISFVLEGVLKPLIGFLLLVQFPASAGTILCAYILSLALVLFYLLGTAGKVRLFSRGHHFSPLSLMESFRTGAPLSVGSFFNWIQLQGYRLLLVPMGAAEVVGVYSVISGVGHSMMGAVAAVYNQARLPKFYRDGLSYLPRYISGALILIALIFGVASLGHRDIVRLLTSAELSHYSALILFGVLVEGANLLIGGATVAHTFSKSTPVIASAISCAALVSAIFFAVTTYFEKNSTYSIGMGLLLSQLVAIGYLYLIRRRYA